MVANRLLLYTAVATQPSKSVVADTQMQIFKTAPGPIVAIYNENQQ